MQFIKYIMSISENPIDLQKLPEFTQSEELTPKKQVGIITHLLIMMDIAISVDYRKYNTEGILTLETTGDWREPNSNMLSFPHEPGKGIVGYQVIPYSSSRQAKEFASQASATPTTEVSSTGSASKDGQVVYQILQSHLEQRETQYPTLISFNKQTGEVRIILPQNRFDQASRIGKERVVGLMFSPRIIKERGDGGIELSSNCGDLGFLCLPQEPSI